MNHLTVVKNLFQMKDLLYIFCRDYYEFISDIVSLGLVVNTGPRGKEIKRLKTIIPIFCIAAPACVGLVNAWYGYIFFKVTEIDMVNESLINNKYAY